MKFVKMTTLLGALLLATPVTVAQEWTWSEDQNAFVMGGAFSNGYFGNAFRFWEDHYESNFFAGAGYQRFLWAHEGGFKLGVEAGLGLRMGDRSSVEAWLGAVGRFDVFEVGDFNITPSLTFGLSVVSDTIGIETQRAQQLGLDAVPVLFYMGPEIAVSHDGLPNVEAFGRVQHRSGGFGTIAPIDGSNAAVLGVRYKF